LSPPARHYSLQALEQHGAAAGSYLTVRRLVRCHPWCDGGHDPVPATIAAQHAAFFAAFSFQHPTILTKEVFMNDIRRTILWVIFGFSMVLLWDKWQAAQRQQGHLLPFVHNRIAQLPRRPLQAANGARQRAFQRAAATTRSGAAARCLGQPAQAAAPAERERRSTDVLEA
jgi:hypothetical protein